MNTKMKSLFIVTATLCTACAGTPRVLQVQTEPADAQVCIKGKAGSHYLTNDKQCVGSTPYEAEKVQVNDADGNKHWVNFKDVENDKEQFYLVVSRNGYEPVALNVPVWEHKIKLKPELQAAAPAPREEKVSDTGSLKITSNPVGALVYVNDYLKGNTPYTYEAKNGEVLRIKLEQTGYALTEKSMTMEAGRTTEVNLVLEQKREPASVVATPAPALAPTPAPAPTSPVAAKIEEPVTQKQ